MKKLFLLLLVLGIASDARANLILNGSFESYEVAVADWEQSSHDNNVLDGSTLITNWTVINAPIDYIGSLWQASDGDSSLDLAGSPGVGGVRQTFSTVSGASYVVQFDLSANPAGGTSQRMVRVGAAGQFADFTFDRSTFPNTYQNMMWETHQFLFVANNTTTTLDIFNLVSADNIYGPALDNVSVNAVPLPGAVLLGAIGLSFAGSRLRRRAA